MSEFNSPSGKLYIKSHSGKVYSKSLDVEWVRPNLPFDNEDDRLNAELIAHPLNGAGGVLASMYSLTAVIDNKDIEHHYILKTTAPTLEALQRSIDYGLPRESIFFKELGETLSSQLNFSIPKVFACVGDMKTGQKDILMEDLSEKGLQSGLLFGPKAPLNLDKNLDDLIERVFQKHDAAIPSAEEIAMATFKQIGLMHKYFWEDETIIEKHGEWLRSSNWGWAGCFDNIDTLTDIQREWESCQSMANEPWRNTKNRISNGSLTLDWDDNLFQCLEAAMEKIDWFTHVKVCKKRSWTLTHGDFHPGNVFWLPVTGSSSIESDITGHPMFLDWEFVGVGNGPSELGWYLIFHMDPEVRRNCEENLLINYYESLTAPPSKVDISTFTFSQMKEEYIKGGSERAIFIFCYLSDLCEQKWLQSFHNQIASFLTDHNINPQNVGFARA